MVITDDGPRQYERYDRAGRCIEGESRLPKPLERASTRREEGAYAFCRGYPRPRGARLI